MIDMNALQALVRARRGPDCIDVAGACRASPEVAQWYNRLHAMIDAGATSAERKAALEPTRRALRKAGHNI